MAGELTLSLNQAKDLSLVDQSKNIISNIGTAFSNAVKNGTSKLEFPDNLGEKVKEGLSKIDLGEIGGKAAETALKTGLSKLGIKSNTFNSVKQIFEAVKEGDLKKGLSSGLNVAIDFLKVPTIAKNIIKEGKDLILGKTLDDELKTIMKKQQNTVSRINNKCKQMEEAFNNNDTKTLEKVYKTLKTDVNNVMPIKDVIDKGVAMLNRYELYMNKGNKDLTQTELELCNKLTKQAS